MSYRKLLKEISECGEEPEMDQTPEMPDPVAMERIPGGLGADKDPSQFDQVQLMNGMHIELEHGSDVVTALEIAMDHMSEDPHYYVKLQSMESDEPQEGGYFTDIENNLESFTVDDDTPEDLKDLRGQNAEKTGTFDLSKMKTT